MYNWRLLGFKPSSQIKARHQTSKVCWNYPPPEFTNMTIKHPPWLKMYFLLKIGDFLVSCEFSGVYQLARSLSEPFLEVFFSVKLFFSIVLTLNVGQIITFLRDQFEHSVSNPRKCFCHFLQNVPKIIQISYLFWEIPSRFPHSLRKCSRDLSPTSSCKISWRWWVVGGVCLL